MINYQHQLLANGLNLYFIEDKTTPIAIINLLYNVGSRDEDESQTGFAHLFEHLMFGGSVNIPEFDTALQKVGGENNAYTSPDVTNYYITLPVENIETGFWLESDRMLSLAFSEKSLEVQRKVVIEEFKQRYLNQPYGDVWLKLRPLAYKVHPYKWATIGKDIKHIEDAVMEDVKAFFKKYYVPNNATLVIAGNLTFDQVIELSEKWFGSIPAGNQYVRNLPIEPIQTEKRTETIQRDVPLDAINMVFHSPERLHQDYYACDLLSDIFGRGASSRLYQALVKEKPVFSSISSYHTASLDKGLFVIEGKLNADYNLDQAEEIIWELIAKIKTEGINQEELDKSRNQAITSNLFGEMELLNQAMALANAANIGKPELINTEIEILKKVTVKDLDTFLISTIVENKCSVLRIKKEIK